MDRRGAIALVTGGNGGLGQHICHALAKQGAHIADMYAQSRDPGGLRRPRADIALPDRRCGVRLNRGAPIGRADV
jgi:NAD(P)-dependent dehydrogenase (short-subunit alcohol dehydrogenase family)